MIPPDTEIQTLAVDIRSFRETGMADWRVLEDVYDVVYIERYPGKQRILLREPDGSPAVALPYTEDSVGLVSEILAYEQRKE